MKKILLLALIVALTASFYVGCKKGPEDPFLSFKSRESRMLGTWKLSAYAIDGIDSLTSAKVVSINGAPPCGNITATINQTFGMTLIFGSDGNYSRIFTRDSSYSVSFQNANASPSCKSYSNTYSGKVDSVEKGIWEFAGGVGQYKNKELLSLIESTDDVVGNTFEIVECSSKELKLKQSLTFASGKDSIKAAHIFEYTFKH